MKLNQLITLVEGMDATAFRAALEKVGIDGWDGIERLHGEERGNENSVTKLTIKNDEGKKFLLTRTGRYEHYKYTIKPVKE